MENSITFYGATWCGDCKRSKTYLDEHHIAYTDINIDKVHGAAEIVKKINHGLASINNHFSQWRDTCRAH